MILTQARFQITNNQMPSFNMSIRTSLSLSFGEDGSLGGENAEAADKPGKGCNRNCRHADGKLEALSLYVGQGAVAGRAAIF